MTSDEHFLNSTVNDIDDCIQYEKRDDLNTEHFRNVKSNSSDTISNYHVLDIYVLKH